MFDIFSSVYFRNNHSIKHDNFTWFPSPEGTNYMRILEHRILRQGWCSLTTERPSQHLYVLHIQFGVFRNNHSINTIVSPGSPSQKGRITCISWNTVYIGRNGAVLQLRDPTNHIWAIPAIWPNVQDILQDKAFAR